MRKIGWILLSPRTDPQPSTRIAALNMMDELPARGYASVVLYEPVNGSEQPRLPPTAELLETVRREQIELVIFQKAHGPSILEFIDALRRAGVKTAYMVCDLVLPVMTEATDLTITVTPYLRSLYPEALRHKVEIVHDGIERAELCKDGADRPPGRSATRLSATLVTSAALYDLGPIGRPPDWLSVNVVGRYPAARAPLHRLKNAYQALAVLPDARARLDFLRFAMHPRIRTQAWSEAGAYAALLDADVGIIPVREEGEATADGRPPMWMRKSENRLTMKMALGLPVVASPVPAYLDIIEQGVNGFIASSTAEWRSCLEALRDPALRRSVGARARQTVAQRYSRTRQAELLAAALDRQLGAPPDQAATQST